MHEHQDQEDGDCARIYNGGKEQWCGCRLVLWWLTVICDMVAADDDVGLWGKDNRGKTKMIGNDGEGEMVLRIKT